MKGASLVLAVLLVAALAVVGCAGAGVAPPLASEGMVGVPVPQATPTSMPMITPTATSDLATPTPELRVAPEVGARAPDFTLFSLEGEPASLGDHGGKVVLLNFWTSW